MNSFTCVALVVLVAASNASPGVRVRSNIEITEAEPGYQSQLPEVYGVRHCGGAGKVVSFRYQPCRKDAICQVPGDNQGRPTELEFVPSENADGLGIRLNLVSDGTAETVYERAVADSAVRGGSTYIVHADGSASDELKGRTVTIQYILFRVEDNNVETCVEADFEIV